MVGGQGGRQFAEGELTAEVVDPPRQRVIGQPLPFPDRIVGVLQLVIM